MGTRKGIDMEIEDSDAQAGIMTINRTGVSNAPELALDMIRGAHKAGADPSGGDAAELAEYRRPYIEALEARRTVGSLPIPLDAASGQAEAIAEDGTRGSLLLDKLGERLAFERKGIRLYECLIGKVRVLGGGPGGPGVDDLEHILEEEKQHFKFLQKAVVRFGGDPTVQTPCADISGVLSQGVMQVVADPRTTVVQCLEAVLNAELMDNDGWDMLLKLMENQGGGELTDQIVEAEEHEREHLTMVRDWLTALVVGEVAELGEVSGTGSKQASKSVMAAKSAKSAKSVKGKGKPASASSPSPTPSSSASSKAQSKPSRKNHR